MDALSIGAILHGGNFCIEHVTARSAFGITYRALDKTLCRQLAVKEYFPVGCHRIPDSLGIQPDELLGHRQFEKGRERFLEEARALALFHHPNIVAVHGFFQENNTAYMTMEWLEGQTLEQLLNRRGSFSEAEVLALAHTLCDALQVVHDAGRLHRDLKPENLLSCPDGRIVILDFGLSTRVEYQTSYGTRPLDETLRFGTPGYAPPEQYTRDRPASPTSDIYALGATLYHLLTGAAPPPATDRAFGQALTAPHEFRSDVSTSLSQHIMAALELKPEARPASAQDFAERLKRASTPRPAVTNQARSSASPTKPSTRAATGDIIPVSVNETRPVKNEGDDAGCFQLAFAIGFVIWFLAGMICVGVFLARIALFGI